MELPRFPPEIQRYLPQNNLSVCEFITVDLPKSAPRTRFMRTQKYISEQPPTVENVNEIASLPPPPDDILSTLQQSTLSDPIKSIQCPHSATAGSQRYHLWLISFWIHLSSMQKLQAKWKIDKELGRGKRRKHANRLYSNFWRHDDDSDD